MPSTLKEEWSGRRDSNPRLTAWKAVALPTELLPHVVVGAAGFEPATPWSQTRCATRLRYAPTITWCTRYRGRLRPGGCRQEYTRLQQSASRPVLHLRARGSRASGWNASSAELGQGQRHPGPHLRRERQARRPFVVVPAERGGFAYQRAVVRLHGPGPVDQVHMLVALVDRLQLHPARARQLPRSGCCYRGLAHQRHAHTGLLEDLAYGGVVRQLVWLHMTAGWQPDPQAPVLVQQHPAAPHHEDADGQVAGRCGRPKPVGLGSGHAGQSSSSAATSTRKTLPTERRKPIMKPRGQNLRTCGTMEAKTSTMPARKR